MPSIPSAVGIARVPFTHRVDTLETAHLPVVAFPDCPDFCVRDHKRDQDLELEDELRLHERVVLDMEANDVDWLDKRKTATVLIERCDVLGESTAPTKIVLSIDQPDAPDVSDVDVDEATRDLSDETCRALAAMCLKGAAVTGMGMALGPAAALQLSNALRQAADWAALASVTNGATRRGAA